MYHVEHELLKENPVFSKFYLSGCNLQTQRRTDIFSCNLSDCYLLEIVYGDLQLTEKLITYV